MSDKYDEAIKYLTKAIKRNPNAFNSAWNNPLDYRARGGVLFQFVQEDGFNFHGSCGCLTQIKGELEDAQTKSLTRRIREDVRIPTKIPTENSSVAEREEFLSRLPVFAEWQRIIDKELNRV